MCALLENPGNGTIVYNRNVSELVDFRTEAHHSCEEGFFLVGESIRECGEGNGINAEGEWSGGSPACSGMYNLKQSLSHSIFLSSVIMCESLSAPLNGTISFVADTTATFDFRTTATYACDKGFALSGGNPERTCEEGPIEGMGAWSGSALTCFGKLMLL